MRLDWLGPMQSVVCSAGAGVPARVGDSGAGSEKIPVTLIAKGMTNSLVDQFTQMGDAAIICLT